MEINFTFTPEDVDLIGKAVAQLPWEVANVFMQKLITQANDPERKVVPLPEVPKE